MLVIVRLAGVTLEVNRRKILNHMCMYASQTSANRKVFHSGFNSRPPPGQDRGIT